MTAVLLVLSLLVFSAGVIAWGVHMRGVWDERGRRNAPSPSSTASPELAPEPDMEVMSDPFAHVGEPSLKDVRS